MHPIQAIILHVLMTRPDSRYSDLKPRDVDPNLFMYHFRKVLGMGLVIKAERGYVLTPEGMRHASRMSVELQTLRQQPTICTFIAMRTTTEEWLMHTRAYQPYLGRKSFPYGKLHWGESMLEAAQREVHDKTGLTASVKHQGDLYLRVWEGDEQITHMLCHVFVGTTAQSNLVVKGLKGECGWEKIDNAQSDEYLPGFGSFLALAQKDGPQSGVGDVTAHLPERFIPSIAT
jgi:ADP-ribose pyrophosphatase YjhB (NUDIX family)